MVSYCICLCLNFLLLNSFKIQILQFITEMKVRYSYIIINRIKKKNRSERILIFE